MPNRNPPSACVNIDHGTEANLIASGGKIPIDSSYMRKAAVTIGIKVATSKSKASVIGRAKKRVTCCLQSELIFFSQLFERKSLIGWSSEVSCELKRQIPTWKYAL